jgi:hypothetical protein
MPFYRLSIKGVYTFRKQWLREHRGILSEIAGELEIKPQTVRLVYWGLASSRRIEAALRERGARSTAAILRLLQKRKAA